MTILAQQVTDRLSKTLHDLGAIRWPSEDMWKAIDDAQKAIIEARPDLFEVTEPVQLVLGPKQPVADDCFMIFDVIYNLNALMDPKSSVTKVDRGLMDRSVSNWMVEGADTRIEHWMQSSREKDVWWTYPPVAEDPAEAAPPWVLMRFAKRATVITGPGDVLGGKDEILNSVYYFAMTRLLERDEKFAGSQQSQMFLTKFGMTVGARTEGEAQAESKQAETEGKAA